MKNIRLELIFFSVVQIPLGPQEGRRGYSHGNTWKTGQARTGTLGSNS